MLSAIWKRLENRDEGFTLIELLIVVIIIGILAAVAIPTFLNQRQRAWRSAVQSDLRNLAVEAETFFADAQTYAAFAIPDQNPNVAGVQFGSPGVGQAGRIAVNISANGTNYCLQASHLSNTGEVWSIQPGNQLARAACPNPVPNR